MSGLVATTNVVGLMRVGGLHVNSGIFKRGNVLYSAACGGDVGSRHCCGVAMRRLLHRRTNFGGCTNSPMSSAHCVVVRGRLAAPPSRPALLEVLLGHRLNCAPNRNGYCDGLNCVVLSVVIRGGDKVGCRGFVRGCILRPTNYFSVRVTNACCGSHHPGRAGCCVRRNDVPMCRCGGDNEVMRGYCNSASLPQLSKTKT